MKALVYSDWEKIELKDVPEPDPQPGEALVRVEACGICGSELEAFHTRSPRRTPPLILGHEFCGTVEKVAGGDNSAGGSRNAGVKPGQRVVANSVISCGKCYPCLRGERNLCVNRKLPGMGRPGAMAEYIAYPAEYLHPCPDSLDPAWGALAEPLVNGIHMMGLARDYDEPLMAVIGVGPIGLMAFQAAKAVKNARLIVSDINEGRLKVAKELGAERIINPKKDNFVQSCIEFSKADGLDVCVDAVGTKVTKADSIEAIRPGGLAIWIGLRDNELTVPTFNITLPEKKITGTYAGNADEYRTAVKLLSEKKVVGGSWIKKYSLSDGVTAFYDALHAEEKSGKSGYSGQDEIVIKYMLVAD
jgi:threonine dehydrogenase-like Zn-dependent dehydrogenase